VLAAEALGNLALHRGAIAAGVEVRGVAFKAVFFCLIVYAFLFRHTTFHTIMCGGSPGWHGHFGRK
jgi:hypothetical protein